MNDPMRQFNDPRLTSYAHPALTRWGERRRIRKRLRELLDTPEAQPLTAEMQAMLDVLLNVLGEASPEVRTHGHWVMNSDWKQKIIDTARWDKPYMALYGLSIVIDDSALSPRLEITP